MMKKKDSIFLAFVIEMKLGLHLCSPNDFQTFDFDGSIDRNMGNYWKWVSHFDIKLMINFMFDFVSHVDLLLEFFETDYTKFNFDKIILYTYRT